VGIPACFLGTDEEAARERRDQAQSCEPVQSWHYLPLTPGQVNLFTAYLRLRTEAITNLRAAEGLHMANDEGPLVLMAFDNQLHPWTDSDTQTLCRDLSDVVCRLHPGYPNAGARDGARVRLHRRFKYANTG
jgi:hypothetical protein